MIMFRQFGITIDEYEQYNSVCTCPDIKDVTKEAQPVRQPSPYDSIASEETSVKSLRRFDMTHFLLHREKTRRKLGDALYSDLLASLHPTQSTIQDSLTDEQRLDMVISRHCQTMSERQAVMDWLSSEHKDLFNQIQELQKDSESKDTVDAAPAATVTE